MNLPLFKYHPDPIKTGVIKESNNVCVCCRKNRGYIYTGPVYTKESLEERICPWCIADGSAHEKFKAEYIDVEAIGNYGRWSKVPLEEIEEIAFKTPGFRGWQQEKWWTHCGEGAEFLGYAGKKEIEKLGLGFIESIQSEAGLIDEKEWNLYLNALNKEKGPTAYVFRCKKCKKLGGYSDSP
jgi:uncharacterized protein CbrC (UPF0167 family)